MKLDGWSKFEEWVEGYAQTWHPATPPPAHLQSPTHNYQMVFGDVGGGVLLGGERRGLRIEGTGGGNVALYSRGSFSKKCWRVFDAKRKSLHQSVILAIIFTLIRRRGREQRAQKGKTAE